MFTTKSMPVSPHQEPAAFVIDAGLEVWNKRVTDQRVMLKKLYLHSGSASGGN
jgi:hypothetical protein